MGNLDSKRDWGDAREFVRMQWMMLQHHKADDFIIASGKQFSIRNFIEWTAEELGIQLQFHGFGLSETAMVTAIKGDLAPALKVGDIILRVDPRYYRPAEVRSLLGCSAKAQRELGWKCAVSAREICAEMVKSDLLLARQKISTTLG